MYAKTIVVYTFFFLFEVELLHGKGTLAKYRARLNKCVDFSSAWFASFHLCRKRIVASYFTSSLRKTARNIHN